ncbi:DUF2336 domain-containing protein [Pseudorhodoplanes sinuspersici]|uniref:DUF2336 domain-containing protein n=1 Tax=Pseudorhodoplanes sinuspersici TaxID=1235591 RepID=UPI000FF866B0|nr:DUF2336 domain-containing protein [Pseudorhodoplanes sinuspersici]RKE72548.1 uncharacterized protein DUF2336 [Pseudorhodoplanes sinuspersici]
MKSLSLENLDGLTGLAGLTDRTGVDTRPILLRVLTDLYIQKPSHTPEEVRHYTELALRLIDVVDAATCATVAEKLKSYPGAPEDVLRRLGVSVENTLSQKPAPTTPVDPWLEDDLGIFEPVKKQSASNPAASATAQLADDYVAQRDAFFASDSRERRMILLKLDYSTDIQHVPLAQGTNVVRYLEQAALAGRFQEFTTLLQQSLGTSRAITGRVIADPLGEPFAVSAKAMAMPADAFQRILMFLNPSISHSVDRVYELSDLFEALPLPAALQMVAIWRAADRLEARKASHRPLHWPETDLRTRDKTQHDQQRADDQTAATNVTQRRTPSGS